MQLANKVAWITGAGSGIRSTVILPAEVVTPILDARPEPPSAAERAKMLKPSDLGELVLFIAWTSPLSVES